MRHPTILAATASLALALSACGSSPSDPARGDSAPTGSAPSGSATAEARATAAPTETSPPAQPAQPVDDVLDAAEALIALLSPEQRDQLVYAVDDPALREWIYFPTTEDRNGIALGDLDAEARAAALGVAEAILSDAGYSQLRGVLAAEDALGVRNGDASVTSQRYFLSFFGPPSATERFTVQLNGHHLAVNHTYEAGRISPTPAFTGVDPVDFERDGERVRPMLAKTEAVSALFATLDPQDLTGARIEPIDDVRVGTGQDDEFPLAAGTPAADLGANSREAVMDVVEAWVGDTDPRVAEELVAQYRSALDRTRVAWSGSTDPDEPGSYLRIDGPRVWIEFSNVGRFANGDEHYHSVLRDKAADYLDRAGARR